jgi:hypothetical protein
LKVNIHPLPFDELSSDWVYKVSTRFPSGYGFFDDDSFKARHNIDSPENEFYSTDFGFPSGDESGLYFYLHPEAYDPSYDKDVLKIANWYIGKLKEFAFSGDLVAPDRGLIPTQSLVMPAILYRRDESQSASVIRCIDALIPQDRRNKTIDLIAHRCLSDHLQMLADAYNQDSDAEETPGEHDAKNSYEPFIDFLNRFLSTHLFVDLAYTLRVKFHQLLPDEGLGLNTTTKRRSRRGVFGVFNTSAIVEIELFDRFGKKTNFEEVGSGVSCALPVIVALWGSGAFIQQPELHLHPALQSSLGDMFLEATTRGSYFLIESHSEYPLLRCLKRLRQSNSGKIKNIDPLFATKDRISVIYFEPNPDGHTNVKRLRLTEEGDFIDRWPRGFFEERGREIFDE